MAAIMLLSSCPARPTNGSPCASSSAPGPSPTNISRAVGDALAEDNRVAALVQRAALAVADIFDNLQQCGGTVCGRNKAPDLRGCGNSFARRNGGLPLRKNWGANVWSDASPKPSQDCESSLPESLPVSSLEASANRCMSAQPRFQRSRMPTGRAIKLRQPQIAIETHPRGQSFARCRIERRATDLLHDELPAHERQKRSRSARAPARPDDRRRIA